MKKLQLVLLVFAVSCIACKNENNKRPSYGTSADSKTKVEKSALWTKATSLFKVLPEIAENVENPSSEAKIALGKKLYFEKALSKDHTQSCNTCHNIDTYGVDNKSFSEGNNGSLGGRNSPTTFNAALHFAQFWDGREPDVESQAGGPILNPVEMEMASEADVIARLSSMKEYPSMFQAAFPDAKEAISYDHLKKAIGAFERTLLTPSKWDNYIKGDETALDKAEKEGLESFIEAGCVTCHTGPLLGGHMYQKFGLFGNYWDQTKSTKIDEGRFETTQEEADKYFFKVPSLRNIEMTYPYFHDGSISDLEQAVRIMAKLQSNKELTDAQVESIVVFLKTLTGEKPTI
ncbi:MAG: cytochrome-c peroxidase [Flavobacteriaceae bacterium]|nr:cytochrome-c peroxidase [Flavobacteriaceae bacterium]